MSLSRIATILTAGLSSAASFYILTRSGLTGTLVGALVSGVVYNVTSLGLNHGVSKSGHLLKTREPEPEAPGQSTDETPAPQMEYPPRQPAPAGRPGPARWLPIALGVAALLVSVWAVTDESGSTLIRERIVERPVVKEKVVVQTVTVTVEPNAASGSQGAGMQPASETSTTGTSAVTTTTHEPSTSTTTEPTTTTGTTQAPLEENPANPGTPEVETPSV